MASAGLGREGSQFSGVNGAQAYQTSLRPRPRPQLLFCQDLLLIFLAGRGRLGEINPGAGAAFSCPTACACPPNPEQVGVALQAVAGIPGLWTRVALIDFFFKHSFFFFIFFTKLCVYVWLCWVFAAALRLSPVAVLRLCLQWSLLLGSTGLSGSRTQQLRCPGLVALWHTASSGSEIESVSPHWQVDF